MLLTITYTGKDTQDLGYLLYKNPYRAQSFEISFGKAHVFYPEVSDERTTAALLLDVDPLDLARGKQDAGGEGLFDYVNDRPYVCSSFMSTAIKRVLGTAMTGRCDGRQDLADSKLSLRAKLHMLPLRGEATLIDEIFIPLGYKVSYEGSVLDESFPEWGNSSYVDLTLEGEVRLCNLLNHLYVLIPVFDKQKHYYVNEDEIEKLLRHGEGWLASHPARARIVGRYFDKKKSYARKTLERLSESPPEECEEESESLASPVSSEDTASLGPKHLSLNQRRLEAVRNVVLACGAHSVIDLGCGEGHLLSLLLEEKQLNELCGVDVSVWALERAKQRLKLDRLPPAKAARLKLQQGSLTYRDKRFSGYDCACAVEVIEHVDKARLPTLARVLFEFAAPKTVIITTPNKEYNSIYGMREDTLRHGDHRFEWTREEFTAWCSSICRKFSYQVKFYEIGDRDPLLGAPTQMGVFTKCV